MAAGEGIETMLSLRCVMPTMPMAAALSAAHLAAILFPETLRRLYIARDDDPAGDSAMVTLVDRAQAVGIEAIVLSPRLGDFNDDLRRLASMRFGQHSGSSSCRRTSPLHGAGGVTGSGSMGSSAGSRLISCRIAPLPVFGRGPRPRPSERAIDAANGPAPQWRLADYFPSRGRYTITLHRITPALYIAKQNSRPPPSSALLRPLSLRSAVQARSARRLSSPRRPRWARSIRQQEAP